MALLKKLALPKSYLRGCNLELQFEDELQTEDNLITRPEVEDEPCNDEKAAAPLKVENEENEALPIKKKRLPSKYNIFIKETLATLHKSHPHLLGKERFSLAVRMWNEQKTS
jgi:hypothetical protein